MFIKDFTSYSIINLNMYFMKMNNGKKNQGSFVNTRIIANHLFRAADLPGNVLFNPPTNPMIHCYYFTHSQLDLGKTK